MLNHCWSLIQCNWVGFMILLFHSNYTMDVYIVTIMCYASHKHMKASKDLYLPLVPWTCKTQFFVQGLFFYLLFAWRNHLKWNSLIFSYIGATSRSPLISLMHFFPILSCLSHYFQVSKASIFLWFLELVTFNTLCQDEFSFDYGPKPSVMLFLDFLFYWTYQYVFSYQSSTYYQFLSCNSAHPCQPHVV